MELTSRNLLSEGILVAAAYAYTYLAAFLYEYGYCSYFSIPLTFINPSLSTVLLTAAAVGGVVLSSFKLLGLSAPLIRAVANPQLIPYRQFFAINAVFVIVGILIGKIDGFSVKGALIFVGLVLLFEALYFSPILFFNRKKPLRERFDAYSNAKPDQLDLIVLLIERFGRKWVGRALILLAVLVLAHWVGRGEAARQERFLTLKSSPDMVVLRHYGDVFIAARFERTTKRVYDDLQLIRLGNHEKIEFRNELVGPLTFAKCFSPNNQITATTTDGCAYEDGHPAVPADKPATARP